MKVNWYDKVKLKYLIKIVYEGVIISLAFIYSIHIYSPLFDIDVYIQRGIDIVFLIDFIFFVINNRNKKRLIVNNFWMILALLPISAFKPFQMFRLFYIFRLAKIFVILDKNHFKSIKELKIWGRLSPFFKIRIIRKWVVFLIYNIITIPIFMNIIEPQTYRNFGDGLWWFLVTLTTVGYGDIFPISTFGKITATYSLVIGVFTYASFIATLTEIFGDNKKEKIKIKDLESKLEILEIQNRVILSKLSKIEKK